MSSVNQFKRPVSGPDCQMRLFPSATAAEDDKTARRLRRKAPIRIPWDPTPSPPDFPRAAAGGDLGTSSQLRRSSRQVKSSQVVGLRTLVASIRTQSFPPPILTRAAVAMSGWGRPCGALREHQVMTVYRYRSCTRTLKVKIPGVKGLLKIFPFQSRFEATMPLTSFSSHRVG